MPDSKRRRSGAPSAARVWPQLPTELAEHIISFLEPNEVPGFRLVNQAAAAQFRGPSYTTIRLSQPVPLQLFAAHWLAPGSTRGLTRKRRRQLLSLTAASGVVANLEVALRAAGCTLTPEVFLAAAAAGRLDMCRWLLQRGCPTTKDGASGSQILAEAARGGHQHVCEWLMGLNLTWMWGGFCEAAQSGSVELLAWLRCRGCEWGSEAFTAAVESGCEEAVEWLLTKGCPVEAGGAPYLAACRNGDLATVRLLRRLGVPWDAVGAPAV
ncbi:hypothetical protein GPECTOR_745g908 [Gonium pectorale]|uniref:F-box domain-containing protein n=1 Tax=Gonium pectorale TaxID=33097 RepID=A0A150FU38_GONPE|nr:hypothetical protein GPECTOR_745g908 [Gonium pectorale]|eukprot:KXZ41131.1 hypothetical protein GPECTOR_745g908 [Gonium pectorale]